MTSILIFIIFVLIVILAIILYALIGFVHKVNRDKDITNAWRNNNDLLNK